MARRVAAGVGAGGVGEDGLSTLRLLVRLPNWVGDVCMALPALDALAARGVALHLAGRGWADDLLAAHGWPSTRLSGRLRGDAALLRARRFDAGLLFTNSLSSAVMMRLAGVSALGHANEGRSLLLGRAIRRPGPCHEVEVFWRLAREFAAWRGLMPLEAAPPARLGLRGTPAHAAQAQAALRAAGVADGTPFVVVAPLAAGTVGGRSKLWPSFPALDAALAARGVVTVCCPGPGEGEAAAHAVPHAIRLAGLGLGAYAAVCRRASMVVANDSGPMHLAAAVDAPVLGVFGVSDPVRTHPWGVRGRWTGSAMGWPTVTEVLDAVEASLQPAAAR